MSFNNLNVFEKFFIKGFIMKNKLFTVLIFVLLSLPAFSQVDRTKQPEPGPAPEIKLGEYESFTLDNGLKVFLVENDKVPEVSYSLIIDRDPIVEGDSAGYIAAAGQLLRTGTKTKTKDQIDEAIDFIGASLSTSSTSVYGSSLKKHTEELLKIFSDVALHPEFKQEELDKINKQTLSGLAAEKDDPSSIAGNVKNALDYGMNHPYGEPMTEETVNNITLQMCKDYYSTYFRPNIAYLAIVGDITKDEAEPLIKKYFGSWEKKDVPTFTYETPKPPSSRMVAIVDRPNAVQSVIHITYPIQLGKGSKDVIPASVMNTILGGGFLSSRLNQDLREKKAFTYGAYSSISSDKLTGNFDASCEARNSVTDSAVTEFITQMKKIRDEKVTEQELQSTINYITGGFARSLENPKTIASFAINIQRYNLPQNYYTDYLKNVAAVTVNDIKAMADKYIQPDKSYVLVVGNADDVAKKLAVFGPEKYYDRYGNEIDTSAMKLPEGLTVKTVIDKYIDAIGGRKNLLKVSDRTTAMSAAIQGVNIAITSYQKAPNKLYQDINAGAMEQKVIFDGENGVTKVGGQSMTVSGKDLEKLKLESTMNLILDLNHYNVKASLKGMEKVDGKDAYKVELSLPSGIIWTQYYDTQTGLKLKELKPIESPQGTFTQESNYSDYKDIDGVKYPFTIKQSMGRQSFEFKVDSIKVNTGLADRNFEVDSK